MSFEDLTGRQFGYPNFFWLMALAKVELYFSQSLPFKARSILVEKGIKSLPELIHFNYQDKELDQIRTIGTFILK